VTVVAQAMDAVETEERTSGSKATPRGSVLTRDRESEMAFALDWLRGQIGDSLDARLKIDRQMPRSGPNGEPIAGVLETTITLPEDIEEYIREIWGGGTFKCQFNVPNGKGGYEYGKGFTIRIAGAPKMNGRLLDEPAAAAPAAAPVDTMAGRAIDVSAGVADRERARADRLEREMNELREKLGKTDTAALQVLLQPLNDRIAHLSADNKSLSEQLLAQANKPPPTDAVRDQLLTRAIDGDSARLQEQANRFEQRLDKMRDDHATELRQLRTNHDAEVKRLEDRHDRALDDITKTNTRAIDDLKAAHAREVKQYERAHDDGKKMVELGYQTRIDTAHNENKRLQAEHADLKAELGKLRERKDKTPSEQLKELAGIKENLDALTGGGDDADKPWYEKAADALTPVAMRVAERFAPDDADDGDDDIDTGAQQQQAQAVVHPPIGRVVRNPEDGQLYIHRGSGNYEGPYTDEQIQKLRAVTRHRALEQNKRRQQVNQRRQQVPTQAGAAAPEAANDETAPPGDAIDAALAEMEQPADAAAPPAPAQPRQIAQGSQLARPNPRQRQMVRGPQPAQPVALPRLKGKPPTPEEVKIAVEYLENAVGRGAKADEVARAAKALIPGRTLTYIKSVGVDNFLKSVADSKPGSPLTTQLGRTFVRQVATFL
jgi:hypothetical protein